MDPFWPQPLVMKMKLIRRRIRSFNILSPFRPTHVHLTVRRAREAGNLNLARMGWGILSVSAKSFQWNIFQYGGV